MQPPTLNLTTIPLMFKNFAATAITAGTPVTIATSGTNQIWRLIGYNLSLSVAGSVIFKEAGTEVVRTPTLIAAQPWLDYFNFGMAGGLPAQNPNDALQLDVTASGSVSGYVVYLLQ